MMETGWIALCIALSMAITMAAAKAPDVSSILLKMHRKHISQPPHDTTLYDVLQVRSNATTAEITKQYRMMSRKYHPDKIRSTQKNDTGSAYEYAQQKLEDVQKAYEILKDDAARLMYHQYGITDMAMAIMLMVGPDESMVASPASLNPRQRELLEWIGYNMSPKTDYRNTKFQTPDQHFDNYHCRYYDPGVNAKACCRADRDKRIRYITARLSERIRPYIEGTVERYIFMHQVAVECDALKHLPMGAQVMRCIGRAYRHAGQSYLSSNGNPLRNSWRKMKHVAEATYVSERAVVMEKVWGLREELWKEQQRQRKQRRQRKGQLERGDEGKSYLYGDIDNNNNNNNDNDNDVSDFDMDLEGNWHLLDHHTTMFDDSDGDAVSNYDEEDLLFLRQFEARQALLFVLQMEALWKVTKIEMDKIIQEACRKVLSGEGYYMNFEQLNGWVTSSLSSSSSSSSSSSTSFKNTPLPTVVDSIVARAKTGEAMILIGDVIVACTKEGTSWKN